MGLNKNIISHICIQRIHNINIYICLHKYKSLILIIKRKEYLWSFIVISNHMLKCCQCSYIYNLNIPPVLNWTGWMHRRVKWKTIENVDKNPRQGFQTDFFSVWVGTPKMNFLFYFICSIHFFQTRDEIPHEPVAI